MRTQASRLCSAVRDCTVFPAGLIVVAARMWNSRTSVRGIVILLAVEQKMRTLGQLRMALSHAFQIDGRPKAE
jgi:hypothetical protein